MLNALGYNEVAVALKGIYKGGFGYGICFDCNFGGLGSTDNSINRLGLVACALCFAYLQFSTRGEARNIDLFARHKCNSRLTVCKLYAVTRLITGSVKLSEQIFAVIVINIGTCYGKCVGVVCICEGVINLFADYNALRGSYCDRAVITENSIEIVVLVGVLNIGDVRLRCRTRCIFGLIGSVTLIDSVDNALRDIPGIIVILLSLR